MGRSFCRRGTEGNRQQVSGIMSCRGKLMFQEEPPNRSPNGGEANQTKNQPEDEVANLYGEAQRNHTNHGNYWQQVATLYLFENVDLRILLNLSSVT
jgi:hypothetical protein